MVGPSAALGSLSPLVAPSTAKGSLGGSLLLLWAVGSLSLCFLVAGPAMVGGCRVACSRWLGRGLLRNLVCRGSVKTVMAVGGLDLALVLRLTRLLPEGW